MVWLTPSHIFPITSTLKGKLSLRELIIQCLGVISQQKGFLDLQVNNWRNSMMPKFPKLKENLKFLGGSRVTYIKFSTGNPQILGAAMRNLTILSTRRPVFGHPWLF